MFGKPKSVFSSIMSRLTPPKPIRIGDVTHVGATSIHNALPTKCERRSNNSNTPPNSLDSDVPDKEELRMRELEEARARAAQMEKTMRWWSDCTANWREKWGKVRAERNKAREENKTLRTTLEKMIKELAVIKREKLELMMDSERVNSSEVFLLNHQTVMKCARCDHALRTEPPERDTNVESKPIGVKNENRNSDFDYIDQFLQQSSSNIPVCDMNDLDMDNYTQESNSSSNLRITGLKEKNSGKIQDRFPLDEESPSEEVLNQRLTMTEMKLEEASKTIRIEREEKEFLCKTIEHLQLELNSVKLDQEELVKSKQARIKELTAQKNEHRFEMVRMTSDLEDAAYTRASMEKKLTDLRKELEKMQAENAIEWGKRERLETEKLSLQRENKKLKSQIVDLEENLIKRNKQVTADMDCRMKTTQAELAEKNKELSDLKHCHTKLKKLLQDKISELEHVTNKSEQSDVEVKKLRTRINQLKRELSRTEDEVDQHANSVRKMQRTMDEVRQQNESLLLQVEHLQTRMRQQSDSTILMKKRRSSFRPSEDKDEGNSLDLDDLHII